MKKLMAMMLGLAFLAGTTVTFAQDQPTKKEKKHKKSSKKKAEKKQGTSR